MTYASLNSIVKDILMQKNYPLHYYIQLLVFAKNCLLELSLDDLKCINTKLLAVGDQNEVDLPNDYVDYVSVGVRIGQNVRPLVETNKINSLVNRDSSFNPIQYNQTATSDGSELLYGNVFPYTWNAVTWNDFGEPIGRLFGYGAGVQDDVFKVVRERNQIQLTENMVVDYIVLDYISSGMDADSATRVDIYARATIQAYVNWQLKMNSRSYGLGDCQLAEQEYINQRKILRARKSDLTPEVLKRIIQGGSAASPKP